MCRQTFCQEYSDKTLFKFFFFIQTFVNFYPNKSKYKKTFKINEITKSSLYFRELYSRNIDSGSNFLLQTEVNNISLFTFFFSQT